MTAIEERPDVVERAGTRPNGRVRLVDQVRFAVIFEGRQQDLTLPSTIPVSSVIAAALRILTESGDGLHEPDEEGFVRPGTATLAPLGGHPLDREQTLAQQAIKDGDLLVLEVGDAEVPLTPVTENASSAIAKVLAATRTEVTEAVAMRFASIAAACAVLVAVGLALNAWRMGLVVGKNWDPWPAAATAGLAVVLLAAGSVLWWRRRELVVANSFWLSALVSVPAAAVMATPGRPGAWHAAFGLVAVIVIGTVLIRLTPAPRGLLAAVITTAIGFAVLAVTRAVFGVSMTYLWVLAPAVALVVLKRSEGLAGWMAKVPVPPFPTVTGKFVFDDAEDIAAEALAAAEHDGTPSVAELTRKAHAANTYLTALVASTAVFFAAGAWGAVMLPGHGRWWLSMAYVLILAGVLVLGGRAFADRVQACIVVATALVMTTLVITKYALWWHSSPMCLAAGAAVLALGVAGLVLVAVVPVKVFSPIFRKLVEWLEYALIVAVVPILFWLLNLYYLARNH